MSAGQESGVDLVAVACVVDSSLLLASEWSRVLIDYVYPLLKRLNEVHPSHQFRLAFVTYGAADTHPLPLLSKRFFAPLSQVAKQLREEPSELGIGQTNSGSGRGLSALEGIVAAIELFDILMTSSNFAANHAPTQSPQKESRSLISHLLHIAASPPDNAQRPHCNTLPHLDFVNWDSIPAELKKRKINLSLISLRNIPKFQELQSSVAGPGVQSPWFSVRTPHILSLAGFPTPQKTSTKRQTDSPLSDQNPETKRQRVATDTLSKTSPALSSARTPQNQRPKQPVTPPTSQPPSTIVSGQNSSPIQPVQTNTTPVTAPAAAALPTSAPSMSRVDPQALDPTMALSGLKLAQMMDRLKALEREIAVINAQMSTAQNTGQTGVLAELEKDRTPKIRMREQIIKILQLQLHYQKMQQNAQASSAGSASSTLPEAGPSTQPSAPSAPSERPTGPTIEEHKPISDSQVLAQFWQSRGGTISTPNGSTPQASSSQPQHPTLTPEMVAQMQKLMEKKGIRPPSFGPSQQSGAIQDTGSAHNIASNKPVQAPNPSWQGTFSVTFLKFAGQVTNEIQIHMLGALAPNSRNDIRTDSWPKNFSLKACKEPLKDDQEIKTWLKRHQSRGHMVQFRPNPRVLDGNEQKYQALYKFMVDSRIYAYTEWQIPPGNLSYNLIIFPLHNWFAGAVFPDGLPDLPGSGKILEGQPVDEVNPQSINGLNLPPAFIARLQTLEPAKRKQLIAHILQQQLRQQQLQQTQLQPNQIPNPIGTPIPANQYHPVVNIPAGLHANLNGPTNAGALNTGNGTVNYEMLQSFMQRNAEGSTSQGMNVG